MEFPDNLKYTKEHEWVRLDSEDKNVAVIGITDYAQDQLGDIVYVELPKEGEKIEKGEPFGVVESVKAVSDIYAAVSGVIVETNDLVGESPETLNEDCYEEGWLIKVRFLESKDLDDLMSCKEYQAFVSEQEE